jgi:hypothetical protein
VTQAETKNCSSWAEKKFVLPGRADRKKYRRSGLEKYSGPEKKRTGSLGFYFFG